ncbi:hypothetical protein FIU87_01960 [Bacillus sp. THAF10]|uniref:hypothetical protein n=1 Tax=Bacillus sp. THAF10 TaxID=2587848 RepID=UPI0012693A20|nr:hypothetical protein [Bacillus sp. THAF10]QFT87405.1 hypothetical protein FIU87_01960 [Bacillus sp. THAF10]
MGHDIYGYNKVRKEVAYARFCKGNFNAHILYAVLDANEFFAGVSGSGGGSDFSVQQIENALREFGQNYNLQPSHEADKWDVKQIQDFLHNCLETAQREGKVSVIFA